MRNMIAALAGAFFGTGLYLSGMTDTQKVQGFLDFFGSWDPTLAFVMGGAILPMAVAWAMTRTRRPVTGGDFPARPDARLDRKLIIGAVLFGAGWGLVGLCPGPALASLGFGGLGGIIFLIAMLAGMMIAPKARRILDTPRTAG
ncbi:MAG: DUF6691 family protein [Sulfitobacter sp.]|uniref:DUF6691 family protein n=1 Tax=Sulfitobacter sp. TaxID=1903071 RepID=UPI0030010C01